MTYRLISFMLCTLWLANLYGQNLVPNPSFEDYIDVTNPNPIDCGLVPVRNWFTPTRSTDYFNADFTIFGSGRGVPNNGQGYQPARTGQAYVGQGIFSSESLNTNYAEHLEVALIDTLKLDSFYRVEIFVSRSNSSIDALGDYGILFTTEPVGDTICIPALEDPPRAIDRVPQLRYRGDFLIDTVNWIPLCWLYKADGTEKFMTLGTFGILPSSAYSGTGELMYYYVDDVSVTPVPLPLAEPILADTVYWCSSAPSVVLATTAAHGSYLWNTGEAASSITVSDPGWYWVETYALDCTLLRDSVWVALLDEAALDVGPPQLSVCPEDFPITLGTGSDLGSFSWNTGSTASSITLNAGGTYSVVQSYACGIFRDTITVLVDEPEPLALAPDSLVCASDFVTYILSASTVYDAYLWSTGATSASILLTTPGTYSLTVTHPCGTFTASHTLVFLDPPALLPMVDTVLCAGEVFNYTAPAGYISYEWSHGPQTASISLADTGTFTLVARHPCGDASTQLRLTYAPPLAVALADLPVIPLGERVRMQPQISSGAPVVWQWWPAEGLSCTDCPEPWLTPLQSGEYQLLVEDQYGCTATASVSMVVDASQPKLYAPNAFSPNGDGVNDQWTLYPGPAIDDILDLEVYDRWGSKVWQLLESAANAPLNGWDGKIAGQLAATGVYVWLAQVRLINGEVVLLKGEVLLVR
jgi:gliding motility-associated-like protein